MKRPMLALFLGALLVAGISGCTTWARMTTKEIPRMEPGELNARLADPSIVVLDVRQGSDWNASQAKIKGSVRESNENIPAWAIKYPKDKIIVLYCA